MRQLVHWLIKLPTHLLDALAQYATSPSPMNMKQGNSNDSSPIAGQSRTETRHFVRYLIKFLSISAVLARVR